MIRGPGKDCNILSWWAQAASLLILRMDVKASLGTSTLPNICGSTQHVTVSTGHQLNNLLIECWSIGQMCRGVPSNEWSAAPKGKPCAIFRKRLGLNSILIGPEWARASATRFSASFASALLNTWWKWASFKSRDAGQLKLASTVAMQQLHHLSKCAVEWMSMHDDVMP